MRSAWRILCAKIRAALWCSGGVHKSVVWNESGGVERGGFCLDCHREWTLIVWPRK